MAASRKRWRAASNLAMSAVRASDELRIHSFTSDRVGVPGEGIERDDCRVHLEQVGFIRRVITDGLERPIREGAP